MAAKKTRRKADPKAEAPLALFGRPMPPGRMGEEEYEGKPFAPGEDVEHWIRSVFIDDGAPLQNDDHRHLQVADIAVLWTTVPYFRQMHRVAATAEIPAFRANAWGKGRQEMQMKEWFGRVPKFLITIDACLARLMSDARWCALIEHELYHCAQERDAFGAPKFSVQTGLPIFGIRGHDVEEFVGVVRRYGVGSGAGMTAQLVEAAKHSPELGDFEISHCCGTCS